MDKIKTVKSISIWIFLVPFLAINTCLILVTQFHSLFPNPVDVIHNTIPYIDGKASISRTARVFPTYLIFKPAMFLTSFFLIKYWLANREIIRFVNTQDHKYSKYIVFFGVSSAIFLIIHSIFLGIKFDYAAYKLFRRVVLLLFIIFELVAQTYLVIIFYSFRDKLLNYINPIYLKLKLFLVSLLIIVAVISIPIVSLPGNTSLKHALEWDYFVAIISFYLLTHFMWRNPHSHTG
tara:strand:+ start:66 stop:770 length:705 start_codon:yes stop_codon:yes gene_type:complete